ncbi:DNA polymerase I [Magnetococcus marinus MC-1]|uniref:DNA polymerase I n=1 Tax=Magnetococcus marinus (strain ATCC BAA-1437 / JCM 17883 / MC-1) TaxID=156889 RepID=A0LCQ8_MAGMM|nr:DNA polymerase I [Magnetococcus marinus]ABK45751.1 DNA polymerase I [Magnetococcus marinus MC-1]
MTTQRLFLIDGSGYLYRAFFGVRNLTRRDGFPTNAIFGFIKMLRKVIEDEKPDFVTIAFDTKAPTFRHTMDAQYKANRKPMPDELRVQIPVIHDVIDAFNIPRIALEGYEADDIIGTFARLGCAAGVEVVVVSGDKDLMQLITPQVKMFDGSKDKWYGPEDVVESWGVAAERIPDLLGLAGDTSDNIPGVGGIGPKTAAQLIAEFGSLEGVLHGAERIKQPKRRTALLEQADTARRSLQLATINREVPLPFDLQGARMQRPNWARLREIYQDMSFATLAREAEKQLQALGSEAAPSIQIETQPESLPNQPNYQVITSEAAFQAFMEQLKGLPRFAVDTETTDLHPHSAELVGISIAWQPMVAYYIPVGHALDAAPEGQLPRADVLAALKPLLESPEIGKTGQNIKYDYQIFKRYHITMQGIERDSMLYSYLLYGANRAHNLDAIATEELGRTTIKFEDVAGKGRKRIRFDQVPLHLAAPYACEDAEVTWQAAASMAPNLDREPGLKRLYETIERPLIPVLAEMEYAGVLVDRDVLSTMSADFSKRRARLVEEIHELAGEVFNVNSTQQLGHILFEKMGIKGGKRTKSGFSTDVSVLSKLADDGEKIPQQVLAYRSLTKLQSTYTDALVALIHPYTGRVHTSYNQAVTLTGRLSSSDPNLQNIPIRTEEGRAIRTAFIAPAGWSLLAADYSQIELRVLAHMGNVSRLKEAFHAGLDIHAATAAELFGVPLAQVTGEHRRMAKTINFGLVYGMSPFGLAKRLGIQNNEARAYMDLYFARYDGVRQHMDATIRDARAHGFVETLGGRRCPIRDINATQRSLREFAERTAINAPLQGSASDLIKLAMIRLHGALQAGGFKARMVLQVHDELVLEVPDKELAAVKEVVRSCMEGVMTLSIPLVVDMGVGQNWGEAH